MKKIIATLAVIFSLTTSATFAYDGASVSKSVLKSFNKEFSGADKVSWVELTSGLYRASFNYTGKEVEAFFDETGNLIATGSVIAEDHLPLLVAKSINEKYVGFAKTEVIEFAMNGETQYLVTLNKEGKNYIIKAAGNGDLELYKKMSK
ncbi:hypothetical protein FRZ67_03655 [Panacibacter ginsenosidivorans]|uniref:Uncharacterized protein n=1 Tax=Panacibacter ginsenosidivorans TaxID=1813871 RepID=A0A5B8V4W5_9BACT|nr:hypothetical protein [Panacibacter ginsenosidivorans]QEC66434.1 hypothetical protein FRZ67_03655 [Panacibacter ginsenosidivorans]